MRHIEYIHSDHFEHNYHRVPPPPALSTFIDFFWETGFDQIWTEGLRSFSDAQFPNLGYTYLINLGNPFTMQVEREKHRIKTDGFLPRYHAIESFHRPGDHLFGIKFRISPVILHKKVNFSEYRSFIFPLSYLMDPGVIASVKSAADFEARTGILSGYFLSLVRKPGPEQQPVRIVSDFLDDCFQKNDFSPSLEKQADLHGISSRTLQRYFRLCTGISAKQALQVMRIRKAIADYLSDPSGFDEKRYGYYDHSHYYKHLRAFLRHNTFGAGDLHLQFLP